MMTQKLGAILVVALAATASMSSVAFAKSVKATANIQQENGACGANLSENPVLGTVTFKRIGNQVTLKVKFTHGEPNTHFQVVLYGPSCTILGIVTEVTTNAAGHAKARGTITVPEADTEFFADPYNGAYANDTPYVSLP